jgi:hypothetical protein
MMISKTESEKTHIPLHKIKHMKQHYHMLNPKQFFALSIPGARVWLLQGPDLVRENKITSKEFFQIAATLMNLSEQDTKFVFNIVNLKLFTDATKDLGKGVLSFFKPKGTIASEKKEAKARCERRLIPYE